MTPTDLAEYARVMKELGVAQFSAKLDRGSMVTELFVVFAPQLPAEVLGEVPEPGGWKAGTGALDAPLGDEFADREPRL